MPALSRAAADHRDAVARSLTGSRIGKWTYHWEYPGIMVWANDDISGAWVIATWGWSEDDQIDVEFDRDDGNSTPLPSIPCPSSGWNVEGDMAAYLAAMTTFFASWEPPAL
jgi:hypothetical protein